MLKKLVALSDGFTQSMCSLFKNILLVVSIYYWSFPALPKMPKNVSFKPNRKLFSQIFTLKFLFPDKNEWESRIMTELRALMEEYGEDISLSHIGFPEDWEKMI